ncbi:MAG: acyltransferase [Pseudomonadota bacterium]
MQTDRMIWLDALRLLAGLSMVGLHATSDAQGQPWVQYPEADRWGPLIIRAVLYMARTELFLIISLFLLMMSLDRRPRPYLNTLGEQARRLVMPFLFWTIFFAVFSLLKAHNFGYAFAQISAISDPFVWIEYLFLGTSKYHMHFLPTLFGLVLFFPVFTMAINRPWLGFAVVAGLVFKHEIDGLIWSNLYGSDSLPWALRATKILTYCGYGMVAGAAYGLWRNNTNFRPLLWAAGLVGIGCFAIKIQALQFTVHTGEWPFAFVPGFWADFLMPVVLFLGVMALAHKHWPMALSRWAPFSFGIYLCHPIFLDMAEIGLRTVTWSPTAIVMTKIIFAVFMTTLFVKVLSRSTHLAWTVGLGPLPTFGISKLRKVQQ